MIIDDKYKVEWKVYGFSHAIPVLRVRSSSLLWPRWKLYDHRDGFDQFVLDLKTLYKYDEKKLEAWFRKAIAEYERVKSVIDAHKVTKR
jgi:hypothetical protein